MNKFKLVLWIIILGIMALVIFQNGDVFYETRSLKLHLWVVPEMSTPHVPLASIVLGFFVFGLLMAWLFGVPERFRNRKTIKRLNALNAGQKDEIADFKKRIGTLMGESRPDADSASVVEGDKAGDSEGSAAGKEAAVLPGAPK